MSGNRSQREVSDEINESIRAAADRFGGTEGYTFEFLCACGCLGWVAARIDEYDAAGGKLFLPGHPTDE